MEAFTAKHENCIRAIVKLRRFDTSSRAAIADNGSSANTESMSVHLAQLKLLNVPSMFDAGVPQADPTSDFLNLSMLDNYSHKVMKDTFMAKVLPKSVLEVQAMKD